MGGKDNKNSDDIKIKFCGANGEVTGSNTLITFPNGLKVVVDIGLLQDSTKKIEELNKINGQDFSYDIKDVSYIVLTHGHIDHVGRLPLAFKRGFEGKVLATVPTSQFCVINIPDSAYLNQCEVEKANKDKRRKNKLEPLFTREYAYECSQNIQGYDFNKKIILDNQTTLTFLPAGHMLGASMLLFEYQIDEYKTRKIIFTGDTSGIKSNHPFIPHVKDLGEINAIICESTYGDRVHIKNNPIEILTNSIKETCKDKKKTLLIATFSIQRSSEIVWLLREVYLNNPEFKNIPIYLDSPMAIKSQTVMDENREFWGEKWLKRDEELGDIFKWEQVESAYTPQASMALANGKPKILISASGMLAGGRIMHHLSSFLPSKNCKILLTGYQGEGTLGRKLLDTTQNTIRIEGKTVGINAKREMMEFSSHADCNQLVELLKTTKKGKLKNVFINHGNLKASENLQKLIENNLHVEAIIPKKDEEFKIL